MAARILVVEDDPDFLQFVQLTLEKGGYLVHPASSGSSAVRWLREPGQKPDLVLLDIGLPEKEMDGISLCKALKKNPATRKIPVLILTAYTDNRHRIQAAQAHAELLLNKPIEGDALLDAVRALLEMPRFEKRGLLHCGNLEVDPDARTIFLDGKSVGDLGTRLFDVFYLLVEHHPKALSAQKILAALKLKDRDEQVAVMISRLRSRLRQEFGLDLIATIPKEGYRLDLPAHLPSGAL